MQPGTPVFLKPWTGLDLPDYQCGYRLVSADLLRRLPPGYSRYALESQMLVMAAKLRARIGVVHLEAIYNGHGSHFRPVPDTFHICMACLHARYVVRPLTHPLALSLAVTLLGPVFFGMGSQRGLVPAEATIGVTYAVAGAVGVLLIAKAVAGEAHDLFLHGNILGLTGRDALGGLAVSLPVLLAHRVFYKDRSVAACPGGSVWARSARVVRSARRKLVPPLRLSRAEPRSPSY